MQTRNEAVRPRAYWWIAVLALAWNLIGLAMFFAQAMLDGEQVLQLPEAQRAVHLATPGWVNLAFAFAVIGGILGALCLLRRRWRMARPGWRCRCCCWAWRCCCGTTRAVAPHAPGCAEGTD